MDNQPVYRFRCSVQYAARISEHHESETLIRAELRQKDSWRLSAMFSQRMWRSATHVLFFQNLVTPQTFLASDQRQLVPVCKTIFQPAEKSL
jgi:hypothetical protein